MYPMKKLVLAMTAAGMLGLSPLYIQAAEANPSAVNTQLSEVAKEGKVWGVIALNRHLNPFGINLDVKDSTATLTGSVESDIDRDLAEQLALGTDGINSVDNQLIVSAPASGKQAKPGLSQQVDDVTLTTVIKSKLLWNSHTEGLNINVSTEQGAVTLKGNADSAQAKALAEHLARNSAGVKQVDNQLKVSASASNAAKVQQAVTDANTAINDTWITSKVKSSVLYDSNLDGLNIAVETQRGMVQLSGRVLSSEEKQLAVETASNIRGVRGVDADALRVDS